MRPSEIRSRVLSDHRALRGELEWLESLVGDVTPQQEAGPTGELRAAADRFLARLQEHMCWEEVYLLPALRDADAWGEERASRLVEDHREQRELLAFVLERLRDPEQHDAIVVRDIRGLIVLLREDMAEEERDLLDARVLRDDVIAIDMEAG